MLDILHSSIRRGCIAALVVGITAAGVSGAQPPTPTDQKASAISKATMAATSADIDILAPIKVDELHYYSIENERMQAFFVEHLSAKRVKEQPLNPIRFIDFLLVHPGQATLNFSPRGPFLGMKVGDPKRWEKQTVPPSTELPPMYGVHWIAFATQNLTKALAKMESDGVVVAARKVRLPSEPGANAAAIYTPDFNLVVLVERPKQQFLAPFAIDHVQLLVRSVPQNVVFFSEVFRGKPTRVTDGATTMEIGQHRFVLSEPEALGIDRNTVVQRDPRQFRSNIDHVAFLYKDTQPIYEYAVSRGYKFVLKPTQLSYFGNPTPYTFGILLSPDGMPLEIISETGRLGARTMSTE